MVEREQGHRAERADETPAVEAPGSSDDRLSTSGSPRANDQSEFERAMEIGRKVMRDHHAVLAALAK